MEFDYKRFLIGMSGSMIGFVIGLGIISVVSEVEDLKKLATMVFLVMTMFNIGFNIKED